MRKTVVICAMLTLFTSFAQAQENNIVSENLQSIPVINVVESVQVTPYPCKTQLENKETHSHFVNFLSNSKATEVCGEKFSTTYFNEEYEKLALLERCELSLKTVPLAIWNLDKYVEAGVNLPYAELGYNKLEEVKSFLAVNKFGKRKVISVSHLYKQNKKLYALNTSFISKDDELFVLTTYDVDTKGLTPKENAKQEDVPEIIKRMQAKEEEKIANVTPAELDVEVRNKIWQEHLNFVKKFKPAKLEEQSKK